MCVDTHVCVSPCSVCSYQSVCLRESRRGRRKRECVREREMLCANPYLLWRIQGHSFMFCQPSVNQFPIKAALNSAAIPIPSPRFRLTVSEVLKHFPPHPPTRLTSDLLQCVQHVLPGQSRPVKLSNDT